MNPMAASPACNDHRLWKENNPHKTIPGAEKLTDPERLIILASGAGYGAERLSDGFYDGPARMGLLQPVQIVSTPLAKYCLKHGLAGFSNFRLPRTHLLRIGRNSCRQP